MVTTRVKIFSGLYLALTSLAMLEMLVDAFEGFHGKYLPSFMLAQKFALPVMLLALSFLFLTFFEPERLARRSTVMVMRAASLLTTGLFAWFVGTLDAATFSGWTAVIHSAELLATAAVTVYFVRLRPGT